MSAPFDVIVMEVASKDTLDTTDPVEVSLNLARMHLDNPFAHLTLVMGGFDEDPRELLDIPEAMAWMRRLGIWIGRLECGVALLARLDDFSRGMLAFALGLKPRDQFVTVPVDEAPNPYKERRP